MDNPQVKLHGLRQTYQVQSMNLSDDVRDSTLVDTFSKSPQPLSAQAGEGHPVGGLCVPRLPEQLNHWASEILPARSQARSPKSPPPPELQTLRQWSDCHETERSPDDSFRKEGVSPQASETVGSYASPLAPLRERDLQALVQWFQREDMYAIETDLNQMLLQLLPAPCWDDDAFEFLREFL